MIKFLRLFGTLVLLVHCVNASELIVQSDVNIKRIGSHPGTIFYISLEEGFLKQCKHGIAYCVSGEPSCKSMLSIALTAKSTGKALPDVRYKYDQDTKICTVWLLSIE